VRHSPACKIGALKNTIRYARVYRSQRGTQTCTSLLSTSTRVKANLALTPSVTNAQVKGTFSKFPVDLGCGETQIGTQRLINEIPLPLHHEGVFALRLEPMWQAAEVVVFTGNGAELQLIGEPEYVEEFRPTQES
jgi:hypothetical protein